MMPWLLPSQPTTRSGDDRAVILGALIWIADKLRGEERDKALAFWTGKGKQAFEAECPAGSRDKPEPPQDRA